MVAQYYCKIKKLTLYLEMLSRETFDQIKSKYGWCSSWAIWSEVGENPKSNIGDLSVLDPDVNTELLSQLNSEIIFVGLNISRGLIDQPFANFHDKKSKATDFKLRYALKDTPLWGGYMTDIIKDFEEIISGKVMSYLKENKEFVLENVEVFRQELKDVGAINPTIIAFGNDAHGILKRHLKNEFQILKVPHYANYISKENYRVEVQKSISCVTE